MATTTSTTGATTSSSSTTGSSSTNSTNNALTNLNVDQFLKLMITQLQNQDPLNPTDNNQILQQLSSMQQISASGKLSTTLDSVLLGQNISSASSLVGKNVTGLTDAGNTVTGVVNQVTITSGKPYLQVGQDQVQLSNVSQINAVAATPTTSTATTTPTTSSSTTGTTTSTSGTSTGS